MDTEEKKPMEEEEVSTEALEGEVVEQEEIPLSAVQDWVARHKEREAKRDEIRQRVRGAGSKKEYFRPAKPQPTIQDDTQKVVAVYARVSTTSENQVSSIENQTLYYEKKIADNPLWTMQEIYSDEGKSGTSLRHRDAFRRMMADAEQQKMDLILCASVSRFARNMADCLEQVAELKTMHPQKPIGVYFETENIYTLDPNSDQSFHIHAMLADWESANKSRRMILSYDQRILTGQYPVSDLLGFRHTKDGNLIIEPEEAKTVRFMFLARLAGYSYDEIAEVLTQKHIMFTPMKEEYEDPKTGEKKKRQVKYYPDLYKTRIGKSYEDYEQARQINLFEDIMSYEDGGPGEPPQLSDMGGGEIYG